VALAKLGENSLFSGFVLAPMNAIFAFLATLPPVVVDTLRLAVWLVLLTLLFLPLERLFGPKPRVARTETLPDLVHYFINNLLPAVALSLPLAAATVAGQKLLPSGWFHAMAELPMSARLPLALLVGEVGYYWAHRACHQVPLLWRFHAVHHSATQVDYLVNTRAHPLDLIFTRMVGLVPMYLFGLAGPNAGGAAMPVFVSFFGILWGFFIHANVRWRFGPLEWLISSPAFHHWHHTLHGPVNRNYASTFPWLDRLFGTHHLPAKAWPSAYGIPQPHSTHILDQWLDPFFPQRVVRASAAAGAAAAASPAPEAGVAHHNAAESADLSKLPSGPTAPSTGLPQ
jgi:sterol desaturase/sphingolipid hydroxylase (fatty acid hydroxylase superfamily)